MGFVVGGWALYAVIRWGWAGLGVALGSYLAYAAFNAVVLRED